MQLSEYQSQLNQLLTKLPDAEKSAALRYLGRTDLFFLIVHLLGRKDVERQWLLDRCREV